MPDEPKGTDSVAEEKQPDSIPESEQTTEVESELPEDASERTREQFEKLKKHNEELQKQLKAQADQKPATSVFDEFLNPGDSEPKVPAPSSFEFKGLPQKQVEDTIQNLVDKDGYLDEKVLKNTLNELKKAAQDAKEEAANLRKEVQKREENDQVRQTHKKYPQLDPKSSNFDPKFFEKVKKEMIVQFVNGSRDFMKAADTIAEDYPLKSGEPSDTQKKQDQVRQINAIGSSASRSSTKPAPSSQEDEDLVRRTRAGDTSALMERLKRAEQ
jgi:hypothetical protein